MIESVLCLTICCKQPVRLVNLLQHVLGFERVPLPAAALRPLEQSDTVAPHRSSHSPPHSPSSSHSPPLFLLRLNSIFFQIISVDTFNEYARRKRLPTRTTDSVIDVAIQLDDIEAAVQRAVRLAEKEGSRESPVIEQICQVAQNCQSGVDQSEGGDNEMDARLARLAFRLPSSTNQMHVAVLHTLIERCPPKNQQEHERHLIPLWTPNQNLMLFAVDTTGVTSHSHRHPDDDDHQNHQTNQTGQIEFLDHFLLACDRGQSERVLHWYETVFGMHRRIRPGQSSSSSEREENEQVGEARPGVMVVRHKDNGLRMSVMKYWQCAEQELYWSQSGSERSHTHAQFIVAEALCESGRGTTNQIDVFLAEHGGAGVQHAAFHTRNVQCALDKLLARQHALQANHDYASDDDDDDGDRKFAKIELIQPPPKYYEELRENSRIRSVIGWDEWAQFERHGLLIDEEGRGDEGEDRGQGGETAQLKPNYLLQVFTRPVLAEKSFFFEFIERKGATGFGEGNIAALWRALEAENAAHRQVCTHVASAAVNEA